MDEFNSDDHYIYYCGQESLRRSGVDIMVNKRVRNAVLGCNLKNDRMISVRFQGKPFSITVTQLYAPTSNAEEAEVEPFNLSFFSVTGWGIGLDYCDIEWFALEMNRDHSVVFEIAPKYCVSNSH